MINHKDTITLWFNHNPQQDRKKAKIYSDGIVHQLINNACPESLQFDIKRNKNGKPFTDAPVDFSYSHSRRAYLYGLSKRGALGLDIECTEKERDFITLSQRYFHTDEHHFLKTLSPENRRLFFYRLWTRKEAWCKLCGGVLWYYLGRSVLARQQTTANNPTLYLTDLTDIQGYAGAVATFYPVHHVYINTLK
ncbi:MAG: 4'-phosphopantetheinyl transferase family protein [Marinicella pacifica]|jgi:phosphopantetheinyl transferase